MNDGRLITYLGQIAWLMDRRGWTADEAWAYLVEVRSRFTPGVALGIDNLGPTYVAGDRP